MTIVEMGSAIRVRIRGRVQGVGFRQWVLRMALQRQLCGWVRNCSDGTVEAVFSGRDEAVQAILTLCRKGPPVSAVDHVEMLDMTGDLPPIGPTFSRLPTL